MEETLFKGRVRGFTLIELMVTIALAAILLAIVVPSYTGLIESSRERSTRDLLVSSIYTAKQQSQSKRVNVYLCPTVNGSSCAGAWGSHWLVYEDNDGGATLTNGDIIVSNVSSKTEQILSSNLQVIFTPTGHTIGNTFSICSNTDNTIIYQIILSRMGRITYGAVGTGC
jgi:type IV fimbrial biogenesis protein FimT